MLIQLLSTLLLLATPAVGAGAGQHSQLSYLSNSNSFCAPASPKGAYYDPTGSYGTTNGRFYNYTSSTLYQEDDSSNQYGIENGEYFNTKVRDDEDGKIFWIYDQEADIGWAYDFHSEPYLTKVDIYVNGSYYITMQADSVGYITKIPANFDWAVNNYNSYYIWIFDSKPLNQAMNEDIFDVVGDATTASAGILGNGFNAMIALFYANGQVTGLGIICLTLTGIALVWFAWRLVLALFRKRV